MIGFLFCCCLCFCVLHDSVAEKAAPRAEGVDPKTDEPTLAARTRFTRGRHGMELTVRESLSIFKRCTAVRPQKRIQKKTIRYQNNAVAFSPQTRWGVNDHALKSLLADTPDADIYLCVDGSMASATHDMARSHSRKSVILVAFDRRSNPHIYS